jgi:hypothetical protein
LSEGDFEARAKHAAEQGLIRPHLAHWELAELYHLCLPLALHHVVWGTSYPDFRDRWLALFGEDIAPHLLSLYLAACTSAAITRQDAIASVASLTETDFHEG